MMAGFADLIPAAMPYLAVVTEEAVAGSTWQWSYKVVDDAGADVDFTGVTGECSVKDNAGTLIIAPTVTFPAAGTVQVAATVAATDPLTPGRYKYEVALTDAGGQEVVVCGGGDSYLVIKGKVRS